MNNLEKLQEKLDTTQGELGRLDLYFEGRQPAAFLAPKSREALGNKLRVLAVAFPKLVVTSLAERLSVTGFRAIGDEKADRELWRAWQASDMEEQSHLAHIDTLAYGRSFVFVWAGADGKPLVTVESPKQVAALHDPATGSLIAVLKQWVAADGRTVNATLLEAETITRYEGNAATALRTVEVIPNPLGEVPVVALVNRQRLLDVDGASEMTDVLDLTDGLNKVMSDAMVSSEYFARPRRWVTGLEIVEDEDGKPINPFSSEHDRVWQSEDAGTKFGQFEGARLDGYADMTAALTQQIGAVSGLPPHYLGLNGDQPPSADAIRSAEASLVAKVIGKQRTLGRAWAKVADLMVKVTEGDNERDLETVWAAPDTRTPGQVADAAAKLAGIGVPLEAVLANPLGYTPSQIETIMKSTKGTTVKEQQA